MALMQRETVAAGWITTDEFADAVAVGNSLPGPIAPQVSAFIGYKLAGFRGAAAGAVGTVVPTTLLMLAAIAYFYQIKDSATLKAMLQAVRPVVVGFLLWTAYDLALTVFKARSLGWGQAVAGGWDKFLIAAVAHQGAVFRILVDEIHELIWHYIDIAHALLDEIKRGVLYAGLDHAGDAVTISLPADEIERHGQVSRSAIIPAVVLIDILEPGQIDGGGQ